MRNQALAENHHSDPRGLFSLSDDPIITGLRSPGGTLSQNRNKHLYSMTTMTNTLKASITDDEHLRRLGRENADRFPSLTFEVSKTTPLIRGNGDPQRVVLTVLEFRPTLEYITIPKLLPKAFLRARMHNTSEFALLEGLANVYIDNSFNGKTKVSATAIQEELILDLGIDPGVQPEPLDVNSANRLADNLCLWKEKYEDFCLLANLKEQSKEYQLALLRHAIGDWGRQILENLTFEDGEDNKEPNVIIRKMD
ncbi:uncharacterized protein DEA37_0000803 [Paragonimus westermani]|uniref:Uncharacterized protein n=1 Tax=Paragonimus westermani TaxID=34504 RepID=A0A5J4P241_9TREM|nr:uncharacterized protein DEA37_0000803 [Paragonimus westermani]